MKKFCKRCLIYERTVDADAAELHQVSAVPFELCP
jgi:hypothetical protein